MRSHHKERAYERVVGLDVGEHGASASLLGFTHGGDIKLKAAGLVEFGPRASEKEIASAVRSLWKQGRFGSYTVCAGIHPESLLWKPFSYPDLTDAELAAALHLDAEEDMQLSSDRLAMDTHLYRSKGGEREGFYVAMSRDELDRLIRILDMVKLFAVIVDVSIMAIANLFIRSYRGSMQDMFVCLAYFNGHHADILALKEYRIIYARSVAAHSTNAKQASKYFAESIMEVIERSRIEEESTPMNSIRFAGASPELEETAALCRELTGMPVEFWNPMEGMAVTRHARRHCSELANGSGKLVGSIGLALRRAL